MKYIISLFLFVVISQFCSASDNQSGRDWLRPLLRPKDGDNWIVVPESDVYEVVASKEEAALSNGLDEKSSTRLDESMARRFTGAYYRMPNLKNPYLVRSVYGYGRTARYTVSRRGNDLLIENESLGNNMIYNKSALVINLDFIPDNVFIVCSIGS